MDEKQSKWQLYFKLTINANHGGPRSVWQFRSKNNSYLTTQLRLLSFLHNISGLRVSNYIGLTEEES